MKKFKRTYQEERQLIEDEYNQKLKELEDEFLSRAKYSINDVVLYTNERANLGLGIIESIELGRYVLNYIIHEIKISRINTTDGYLDDEFIINKDSHSGTFPEKRILKKLGSIPMSYDTFLKKFK